MSKKDIESSEKKLNTSFEEIYEKYFRLIYYLSYNYTNSHEMAEDLTQEVFFKAYANMDKINSYENIKAWLVKVTTNCYFSLYRKQKNLGEVIPLEQQIIEIEAPTEDTPENQLIHNEDNHLIFQYIQELPMKQKTCLILFYFQNLSIKEIALATSTSENSVKNALHKGRNSLKIKMETEEKKQGKLYARGLGIEALLLLLQKEKDAHFSISKITQQKIWVTITAQKEDLLFLSLLKNFLTALGGISHLLIALLAVVIGSSLLAINNMAPNLKSTGVSTFPLFHTTTTESSEIQGNKKENSELEDLQSIKKSLEKQKGMDVENFNQIASFKNAGALYQLDFIAKNNNETQRTTVKVFIEPENGSVDSTKQLTLGANSFTLDYLQAKTMDTNRVKEESYGNANAYWIQRSSDNQIEGFKNISNQITVNEKQLQDIQNTNQEGGNFPLTFSINQQGYQVEKIINVTITKER